MKISAARSWPPTSPDSHADATETRPSALSWAALVSPAPFDGPFVGSGRPEGEHSAGLLFLGPFGTAPLARHFVPGCCQTVSLSPQERQRRWGDRTAEPAEGGGERKRPRRSLRSGLSAAGRPQGEHRAGPVSCDGSLAQRRLQARVGGTGQAQKHAGGRGFEVEPARYPVHHVAGSVHGRGLGDVQLAENGKAKGIEAGNRGGQLGKITFQAVD